MHRYVHVVVGRVQYRARGARKSSRNVTAYAQAVNAGRQRSHQFHSGCPAPAASRAFPSHFADVARELANINARMDKQRSEIVELVFSHLSASGIELNSTLVSQLINRTKGGSAAGDVQDALTSKDVPSSISSSKSSDAGVVQLQAAAKARQAQLQRMQTGLSANTRFLEGSFHGGVAGGAGTHGSPNYHFGQGAGASPRHDSSNHSRAHKAITGELSAHGGRFAGHQ